LIRFGKAAIHSGLTLKKSPSLHSCFVRAFLCLPNPKLAT